MEETKESKALDVAVDVVKTTIAIATGSLVFSVELLKDDVTLPCAIKPVLMWAWLLLGSSAIAGVLAFMAIPMMIHKGKPDVNSGWFTWPLRYHQLAFMVGIGMLGWTLIAVLQNK